MQGSNNDKLKRLQENNALIVSQRSSPRQSFRADGYVNMLNKYGTGRDNSEAYEYAIEAQVDDVTLVSNYESNGLFSKVIEIPASEAVKKGFKLNIGNEDVERYVFDKLEDLEWKEKIEESIRWSRLFGGAIAVMIIDDGGELTDPVIWKKAKDIEEIIVYDRSCVVPDYTSLYSDYGQYGLKKRSKFKMPEYYNVFSIYGSFRVHESRCLVFRNGRLPEKSSTQDFRFWGIPEYNRIKRVLRETVTAHSNSVKLLDRSVQAIYKMKNLAQTLATAEGEDQVVKRLEVIDLARGLLNSIAIDADGEDYDFKTFTLSGVKEVIDSACNMLSALTEIPQTKLFGRSPAGMDATGDSDLENFYSFVDKIRESQMRKNLTQLIDVIIQVGVNKKELSGIPSYKLEFEPLQNENKLQKAQEESTTATTESQKATTAQTYIDMGVISPEEVRKDLRKRGVYEIEDDELPETPDDALFEELLNGTKKVPTANPIDEEQPKDSPVKTDSHHDSAEDEYAGVTGVGVFVVKDGKILVGNREDTGVLSTPGGTVEDWEDAEQTAKREIEEECGIVLKSLIPVCVVEGCGKKYGKPYMFVSTDFEGSLAPDTAEMRNNRFMDLNEIKKVGQRKLYKPFAQGLKVLDEILSFLSKGKQNG